MVIAGWGLLADDRWLAIPRLWMAQDKHEACRRPKESFRRVWDGSRRAPGWLLGDFEVVPGAMGGLQEGPGMDRGGHEPFELTFSNTFGPSDALSLRFLILLGPRTLSPYACAAKSGREFGTTPLEGKWGGIWP